MHSLRYWLPLTVCARLGFKRHVLIYINAVTKVIEITLSPGKLLFGWLLCVYCKIFSCYYYILIPLPYMQVSVVYSTKRLYALEKTERNRNTVDSEWLYYASIKYAFVVKLPCLCIYFFLDKQTCPLKISSRCKNRNTVQYDHSFLKFAENFCPDLWIFY